MTLAPAQTVTDRFDLIIDGLCRAIAANQPSGPTAAPLMFLLWNRLRRMAIRFAAIAVRVHAGTLRSPTRARVKKPLPLPSRFGSQPDQARGDGLRTPFDSARRASPRPPRLPNKFAWLLRLIPAVACSRSQLQHLLLSDPEIEALLSAAPQMRRMLRSLCRMLGIRLPKSHPIWEPIKPSPDLLPPPITDPPSRAHSPATSAAGPIATPYRPPPSAPDPLPAAVPRIKPA